MNLTDKYYFSIINNKLYIRPYVDHVDENDYIGSIVSAYYDMWNDEDIYTVIEAKEKNASFLQFINNNIFIEI